MDSPERIEQTAAEWIARRDAGNFGPADRADLERWLHASTAHTVAFLRLEAAWRQANRLKALGAGVPPGTVPTAAEIQSSPFFRTVSDQPLATWRSTDADCVPAGTRRGSRLLSWAAAAMLLVALSLGLHPALSNGEKYETPVGGLAAVPLPDGSKVILNTDSEIRVSVDRSERRIVLEQGEAFFDVAKDPRRPFIVIAGDRRIVAVGTQFSVRRAGDDVKVVVTEGLVKVIEEDAPDAAARLPAGAVASTTEAGLLVQERSLRDAEEALSWRSGYLVFRETALADAVAEFNRYNRRKLVIEDETVAAVPIGGHFRATNVDAFVRLLEQGAGLHAQWKEDRIVLTTD